MVLDVVYDFALMSALLLVGTIIRSKVRFFQRLYIPASLIAGFLGLFLGKQFLNVLPFSDAIADYPGILIAVVFGSLFLGTRKRQSFKRMFANIGDIFLVNGADETFQFGFFTLLGVTVLPLVFPGINEAFGLMLPAGFAGGHGTAAAVGSALLEGSGWEDAASVGQTFATVGLLLGLVGGVALINFAARRGQTKVIVEAARLPEDMLTGLVPKERRSSLGDATTSSMSIDALAWHLVLVLVSVGGAYLLNTWLKVVLPSISFPVYALALVVSVALQLALSKLGYAPFVDKQVITHVGSSASDYLVGFGVASISVNVVVTWWVPIVLLVVLGYAFVLLFLWGCSKLFHTYWFERAIYIYGQMTGVIATGVILLRLTDPEFETGVLEDFGLAWVFLNIMDMLYVSFAPAFVMAGQGALFGGVLIVLSLVAIVLARRLYVSRLASA